MTEQNQPAEGEQSWEPQQWEPKTWDAEPPQPATPPATDPYGQPVAPEYAQQAAVDPYGQPAAPQYQSDPVAAVQAEAAPDAEAQAVIPDAPAADPYGTQPVADPYGAPPADAYAQPAADPYGAPPVDPYAQPAADPYGAPPVDPYGAPPVGGGYAAPTAPPPGYGVPAGYGPQMNPAYNAGPNPAAADNLRLNYWLSVFFSWIPALIFMLTEKDKGALLDDHLKENMNFQITRVIAGAIFVIPVIGWAVGGIASVVLFVIAIMGALKAPDEYLAGRAYRFPFSIRIIK